MDEYQNYIKSIRGKETGSIKHHIHPRSLGGSNDPDNIIKLTPMQHLYAHYLMARTLPFGSKERRNMIFAFKQCMSAVMKELHKINI